MVDHARHLDEMKVRILKDPEMILDDPDVMRALVIANDKSLGSNVVDLRGIAMERLEARLDRLEDTHRSVIAAAYDNLSGTNQIHRAVMRLLEPVTFGDFLNDLSGEIAEILRVDTMRLVLESETPEVAIADHVILSVHPEGFVKEYVSRGRTAPQRQVTLRSLGDGDGLLYSEAGDWLRSEVCLTLDFGAGRLPGLLAMGSEDPHQFSPTQGTDLMTFFAGVVERAIRRFLA
ncbi:MAG: DUF484 family protein [Pseudomonadota bacterium]